jgi:putative Mn2+ efflux pump MntP
VAKAADRSDPPGKTNDVAATDQPGGRASWSAHRLRDIVMMDAVTPGALGTLAALGIGLSVDAFAAAVAKGAGMAKPKLPDALRIGVVFGIFEAIMPAIGWMIGRGVSVWFNEYGTWVAFLLLAAVGGHMIWQAFHGDEEPDEGAEKPDRGNLFAIAATAVATSLDALAVGVSIAVLGISLIATCITTLIVTTLVATGGVIVGHRAGLWLGRYAEIGGGAVLLLIGFGILGQHLLFGG